MLSDEIADRACRLRRVAPCAMLYAPLAAPWERPMLRYALSCLLLLTVAACSSGPGASNDPGPDAPPDERGNVEKVEREALARIGDVRVYYYQKAGTKPSAVRPGTTVEQPRQLHVLVNKGHSFYADTPDYKMLPEERLLNSVDMHDLLVILRDQMGFFERGASLNIKGEDPIRRADREERTDRMIAVQQIKDGKVNTSYFARRIQEESIDAARSKTFNDCQAIVLQALANALPRGSTSEGSGDRESILPGRGN